jgi:hypothetical protein
MAWNGRNVSILGDKAASEQPAPSAAPSKEIEKSSAKSSEVNKKSPTAPPPAKSVWNGQRHTKIMGAVSAVDNVPTARSPSPAISTTASSTTVSSTPKDHAAVSKEDETTNSTAGSSTTNITVDSDSNPPTLEGNVVTTVTDRNSSSEETEKADNSSAPRSTNNNRQQNQYNAKNTSSSSQGVRRSGSNGKLARGGSNNGNYQGNNKQSNSFTRGSGSGGSGRRRVNNGDRPVCSFFMRGMCNRGTSCTFRHDPAHAPAPSSNNPSSRKNSPPAASKEAGVCTPAPPSSFAPNKRVFDPHKARAIQLAKEAQDKEDRSRFASTAKRITQGTDGEEEEAVEEQPFFSIDVECIATGYGSCAKGINDGCGNAGRNKEGIPADQYNDRSHRYPGRVAMVDSDGNVVADVVIRPPKDGAGVVSYLTPLTGLTSEMCLGPDAKSLEEAVDTIKGLLPKNGILVGQAIDHDVEWLGLVPGKDFDHMLDISMIFRQRMPAVLGQASEVLKKKEEGSDSNGEESAIEDKSSDEYLGFATRYRHFSLRHVCLNLLGTDIQSGVHDPIVDAKYSLTLFHKYRNSSVTQLRIVRDGLHRAPITPGFAAENTPVIDGVCVSAAGYPYKRAARKILRWYLSKKKADTTQQS